MNKLPMYSPQVRERAVRMVFEHREEPQSQWAAIISIASEIGCMPETLRKWARQAERDQERRGGLTSSERGRLKELEREVSELKRANEILRKAAADFAPAELDRRTIGWRVVRSTHTALVLDALEQVLWPRSGAGGVVHHSGRGWKVSLDSLHRVFEGSRRLCRRSAVSEIPTTMRWPSQ